VISIKFGTKSFDNDMNNFMNYSFGFLQGVEEGKPKLLKNLAEDVIERLKNYIDSMARVNPEILHHVYEWYQVGSPSQRLYSLNYKVSKNGISFNYTFSQSRTVKAGSTTPFYNKAQIIEEGLPVTISPRYKEALRFEDNGKEVFVRGPVQVSNPGGAAAAGGFNRTVDSFFSSYFTQSFLLTSGVLQHLKQLKEYRDGLKNVSGGRPAGVIAGVRWCSQESRFVNVYE